MNLYPWQAAELRDHIATPKRAWFAAPRVGKTLCACLHIKQWNPVKAIVASPLSVCPMWAKELRAHGFNVVEGYGRPVKTVLTLLEQEIDGILVLNDDRLSTALPHLFRWKPEVLIGDESHRYRGVSSLRGKAFRKLAHVAKYVRILTGTPTPNHYGNLWGQMSALSEIEWGKSFAAFSRKHLIIDQYFHNKIIGVQNLAELERKLAVWATVVRREDVFGPDTWQEIVRDVELPIKSRQLYDQLFKQWVAEYNTQTISGEHILTRLMRLQQITSGFVKTEGGIEELNCSKIEAVIGDLEDIIESSEKCVIFHRFEWEGQRYASLLANHFKKTPIRRIYGKQNTTERQDCVNMIQTHNGAAIAIVQTQAGGTGVNLSEANHAMFVSQLYNYDDEKQARDRIFKPGARRTITYYRATRSVDNYIASVVARKHNLQEEVMRTNPQKVAYYETV